MIKRLITLIKGIFLGLLGKAEDLNPKAVLESEKDNLRKTMAKYDQKIAQHKGNTIKAEADREKLKKEIKSLETKIKTFVKMGSNEKAGKMASQLKRSKQTLFDLEESILLMSELYETLMTDRSNAMESAKELISEVEQSIDDAELNESMADMKEISSDFGSELSNSSLSRLQASQSERASEAKGRVAVANDSQDYDDPTSSKEYRSISQESDLADFLAEQGMEATPSASTTSTTSSSSMGSESSYNSSDSFSSESSYD